MKKSNEEAATAPLFSPFFLSSLSSLPHRLLQENGGTFFFRWISPAKTFPRFLFLLHRFLYCCGLMLAMPTESPQTVAGAQVLDNSMSFYIYIYI